MSRVLVTVGSDANTDWVQTQDGVRYTLGPVSVAKLLASSAGNPRKALESFLLYGEVTVPMDLDRMWEVLKPIRARFGSDSPFMPPLSHRRQV